MIGLMLRSARRRDNDTLWLDLRFGEPFGAPRFAVWAERLNGESGYIVRNCSTALGAAWAAWRWRP